MKNKYNNEININTYYLSKEVFYCLKGYLSICVLIHHLFQFTGLFWNTFIGYPLYLLGHFSVVIFLFISGFGLGMSEILKPNIYISSFIKKRLLPYYVTYLFFLLVYIIFELINGNNFSWLFFLKSLFYGGTYVSFGWYFQITLLLYIVFFLIYRFFRINKTRIILLWFFVVIFIYRNFRIYPPDSTYLYVFFFAVGVSLSYLKDKITYFISKKSFIIFILLLFCFIVSTMVRVNMLYKCNYEIYSLQKYGLIYLFLILVSDSFLIFMVITGLYIACIMCRFIICNSISRVLGKYSLEIYAIQGLVFRFFNGVFRNVCVYIFISIIVITIAAITLHNTILKKVYKLKNI